MTDLSGLEEMSERMGPGDVVAVRTADGLWIRKVIVSEGGYDFPCWNVRWEGHARQEFTPWPIEDVVPLSEHPDALDRFGYQVAQAGKD